MVTITIPEWFIFLIAITFLVQIGLNIWKNILNEQIKKETKKLVDNQKLIKELNEKLSSNEQPTRQP